MTKTKTKTKTEKISYMPPPLVLNFESFYCDLLASVGLVNKN